MYFLLMFRQAIGVLNSNFIHLCDFSIKYSAIFCFLLASYSKKAIIFVLCTGGTAAARELVVLVAIVGILIINTVVTIAFVALFAVFNILGKLLEFLELYQYVWDIVY